MVRDITITVPYEDLANEDQPLIVFQLRCVPDLDSVIGPFDPAIYGQRPASDTCYWCKAVIRAADYLPEAGVPYGASALIQGQVWPVCRPCLLRDHPVLFDAFRGLWMVADQILEQQRIFLPLGAPRCTRCKRAVHPSEAVRGQEGADAGLICHECLLMDRTHIVLEWS